MMNLLIRSTATTSDVAADGEATGGTTTAATREVGEAADCDEVP
jgi:hypothetical protein